MFETVIAEMKSRVGDMLRRYDSTRDTSAFWGDTARILRYLIHLPPDELRLIRFHASFIVGESPAAFWHPIPPPDPEVYAQQIGYLDAVAGLSPALWIGESPNPDLPGAIGVPWRGLTINPTIVRYQHCIRSVG
jgi:hypothetical protein